MNLSNSSSRNPGGAPMKRQRRQRNGLISGLVSGLGASMDLRRRTAPALCAAAFVFGVGFGGSPAMASSTATAAPVSFAASATQEDEYVQIVLRNGNTVVGKVLSETSDTIRIMVDFEGITAETEYRKSELLGIARNFERPDTDARPGRAPERSGGEAPSTRQAGRAPEVSAENAVRVYVAPLRGFFGRDITPTPVRQLLEDAARNNADIVIFELNAESQGAFYASMQGGSGDDLQNFDEFWAAQSIGNILQTEVGQIFPASKRPRIIFWVRKAMGGAAFLPFMTREVYFHPSGLQGGVGNLDVMFGDQGDEVVRDKQRSLRLGTAKGWAIETGYDPDLIEAMTMRLQRWAWRLEGGRPVLRRLAENEPPDASRGELMLTDSGLGDEEDKLEDIVRGLGNDVLTLNASLARDLNVARGVAATIDELLFELRIARTAVRIDSDAQRIFERWSQGLVNAERQLRRLVEEFGRVEVGGTYQERTRARGQQRRLLEEMRAIQLRYEEAIIPQIAGAPDIQTINIMLEQIRLQQLADRP